jgi:hypothetical protein
MSKQFRSNEEIYTYFVEQGCVLMEDYINAFQKMKYVCKCGRTSQISWNHFYSGRRCGYCHTTGRKKKYSTEEVRQVFLARGCELLENKYINNKIPMKYICKCGNESMISFTAFLSQNQYCILCAGASRSRENNINWKTDRLKKDRDDLLRKKCSNHICRAALKIGTQKEHRIIPSLGYSPNDLAKSLNLQKVDFQIHSIDHVFPVQAFLDFEITDMMLINRLDNLRLTTKRENYRKGSKYNKTEFLKWLAKKGIQWSLKNGS